MANDNITRWQRFKCALIVFSALLYLAPTSAQAATIDTTADGQTFIVTGGVIHSNNYTKDREEAAVCTTCFWRIHIICSSWDDSAHGWCPSMLLQCPRDQRLAEVFRADALTRPADSSELWHRTGYTCLSEGGPASVVIIRKSLTQVWRIPVPPLEITSRPPLQTIVNTPTKIVVLSPDSLGERTRYVAGTAVKFRAAALRRLGCSELCSVNPQHSAVTFNRRGKGRILTVMSWTATFDALGLENIPVSDALIVQRKVLTFDIASLHRTLTLRP